MPDPRSADPEVQDALRRWFALPEEERDRLNAELLEEFAHAEIEYGPDYPEWLR